MRICVLLAAFSSIFLSSGCAVHQVEAKTANANGSGEFCPPGYAKHGECSEFCPPGHAKKGDC
jgi:hypothetical protein